MTNIHQHPRDTNCISQLRYWPPCFLVCRLNKTIHEPRKNKQSISNKLVAMA